MENNEEIDVESDVKESFRVKLKKYFKNLFDFSQYDKKTIVYIIVFILIIGLSGYLFYYLVFIDDTLLYRIVVEWVVNPIYLLGFIGIILFVVIMGLQGIIAPIPSEVVLLATGMIYGFVLGGIMGSIGSVAAGVLCYYISKKGGRPLAEKFVGEKALSMIDELIHKYGTGIIIVARLLPFIPFDPISYASGLVDMDVKKYTLGTAIGSIPRAFFYAWLGFSLGIQPPININDLDPDQFASQAALFNTVLLIIAIVFIVGFGLYYLYSIYWERKQKKQSQ